jgi:preprotein translocase subunit SecE
MALVQKTREYTTEVAEELKKVTWPDWPQLKSATIAIIVFVIIVSLLIFGIDFVVRTVINFIIGLFT